MGVVSSHPDSSVRAGIPSCMDVPAHRAGESAVSGADCHDLMNRLPVTTETVVDGSISGVGLALLRAPETGGWTGRFWTISVLLSKGRGSDFDAATILSQRRERAQGSSETEYSILEATLCATHPSGG